MRWNYNDDYRDLFGKGVHRDILIVPHATNVIKVPGGPPTITSKVPVFDATGAPTSEFQDVDWVITNDDIVKEKFKYAFSLNPNDNISFSAASSACVQFTIRNKKEYNIETNRWENEIPNLQYYSFLDSNGDPVIGELEGNYIIKVYMYFNGDSNTLLYLGMFRVEEDKAVDNGYNREILAYDFMQTFRDMDIFNWYKHLFTGINKLDNDYIDATNKSGQETKKPDNYDDAINWVRRPQEKWTIKNALIDLIDHLAAYDMVVYDDNGNALVGHTSTNPTSYGRDYGDGVGYSGLGMPIAIDPEILDTNSEYHIPTETGANQYECYGYMKILDLEFMQDPSIIKGESLSMGKFLEDIGVLAGRYPYIRTDKIIDDVYHDPSSYPKGQNRYNNYEKCILTFKPLPSSKEDKTSNGLPKLQPEQCFSNHEIVKGFQHELFQVKDVMIVKIGFDDKTTLEFKKLTQQQRLDDQKKALQTFSFSGNIFCSYLVETSDDEEIKKNLEKYKDIRKKLFGKKSNNGNMSSDALFTQGYTNIKYRNYVPYKLTTFADPVRDVGDRILINFEDKITGEHSSFYTFILERQLEGIQKMMDTYIAQGQISNPVFSNYQAGTKYESALGKNVQLLGYRNSSTIKSATVLNSVSPDDLVYYLKNIGVQLHDEPFPASAKFTQGGQGEGGGARYRLHYLMNYDYEWPNECFVQKDALLDPTTNPIDIYHLDEDDQHIYDGSYTAVDGDIVSENKGDPNRSWDMEDWNYMYYHGYWYKFHYVWCEPQPDPVINEDEDGYFEESVSTFYVYEKNEDFDDGLSVIYGTTNSQVTVNGNVTSLNSCDKIACGDDRKIINDIQRDLYPKVYRDNLYYYPQGILAYYPYTSGYGTFDWGYEYYDIVTLGSSVSYRYLGTGNVSATGQALVDGDTATKLVINGNVVVAEDYNKVKSNNKMFIYFDKTWHDINAHLHQISNDVTTIPEIEELVKYNSNNSKDYNNLKGVDITLLTINNTEVEVKIFDTMRYYDRPYTYNYVYLPTKVWDSVEVLTADDPIIDSPIRGGSFDVAKCVELKWEDPADITEYTPLPAAWEGTVVIRKEDAKPKHRWDGVKVVDSHTRDEYKDIPYKDTEIELAKVYYYGFFPYYTARTEDGHDIKFYRFTKVIKVETDKYLNVPRITKILAGSEPLTVFVYYEIPKNDKTYSEIKLYGRIDTPPKCNSTDNIIRDVSLNDTAIYIGDLRNDTKYYFCIQSICDGEKLSSNVEYIYAYTS